MAEEFEFQDLSDAVFWGVDLQRATFRDVDLTGARVSHARLVDVAIDAEIERLVVNGVDVTDYVNERDVWFTLRSQVRPTDVGAMRRGWADFHTAWSALIERAHGQPVGRSGESVDGEWSFVETLRHLVFAIDKWFSVPIIDGSYHRMGLPNSGSADFGWTGLDPAADPSLDAAVAVWHERFEQLRTYLERVTPAALNLVVEVAENGPSAIHDCIGVVFEEHFQHLRYATRDLDRLG